MKKYTYRLIVAVLAFFIGTTVIYFSVWDIIKTSIPTQIISSRKRIIHSSENNSPYSLLEGRTIWLKPYNASFDIPESWLVPKTEKNLYLSWQELNEVNRIDSIANGFDEEDAQVINSVLPFENCAAHFGDKDWGNGMWNDLQARVYIVDSKPEEIAESVQKKGLAKATNVFESATLSSSHYERWQKQRLKILDAPTHFMLNKSIDFYYQPFGNKTVVFVFIRAYGFDETVNQLLSSFRWQNGT